MNRKMLNAQLRCHGKVSWTDAIDGFNEIEKMTKIYNTMLNGKWKNMMDFQPRRLPVFLPVDTTKHTQPIPDFEGKQFVIKPSQGSFGQNSYLIKELGYSRESLALDRRDLFCTELPASTDSLQLMLAFVPNHPVGAKTLEVQVSIGNEKPIIVHYQPDYPAEDWMRDVISNQARRVIVLAPSKTSRRITVRALTLQ